MIFFPFDVFLQCVTLEVDRSIDDTHEDVFQALRPLYLLIICGPVFLRRQFHELCRENPSSAYDINSGLSYGKRQNLRLIGFVHQLL